MARIGAALLASVFFFLVAHAAPLPQGGKKAPPPTKSAQAPIRQIAPPAITVDVRPQLFATLCALDAAGFDSSAISSNPTAARVQLRDRMRALQGPGVDALRTYYRQHAHADPGDTLSSFVSFALAAGPPPSFAFELGRDELPPDVLALDGFNAILANFYREAKLDQLWNVYAPEYNSAADALRAPVSEITFSATTYLREILKSNAGRTFAVYVDPLVGTKANFRNYGNQYALVIGPGAQGLDLVRHAFLHFMLDPAVIHYRTEEDRASSLLGYAAHAPNLSPEYQNDFTAFFDECLVRAVELRLRRLTAAELAAAIDQDEANGYVLERPIYAGLAGFEKSEPSISYYLPDLIKGIDVAAEQRRLRGVTFSSASVSASASELNPLAKSVAVASAPASSAAGPPAEGDLAEGQRQIAARNGPAAATAFERVLATSPNDLRAIYGLAVASALSGDADRARELFSKITAAAQNPGQNPGPDSSDLSWSHIYLGRMYDVEGSRDLAVEEYRAALAVNGAPDAARAAAQHGVDAAYQTPLRESKPDEQP